MFGRRCFSRQVGIPIYPDSSGCGAIRKPRRYRGSNYGKFYNYLYTFDNRTTNPPKSPTPLAPPCQGGNDKSMHNQPLNPPCQGDLGNSGGLHEASIMGTIDERLHIYIVHHNFKLYYKITHSTHETHTSPDSASVNQSTDHPVDGSPPQ